MPTTRKAKSPAPHAGRPGSGAEADEAGVWVVEAASEAEGLEAGVGVAGHPTELVEIHLLDDSSRGNVYHGARRSNLIGE